MPTLTDLRHTTTATTSCCSLSRTNRCVRFSLLTRTSWKKWLPLLTPRRSLKTSSIITTVRPWNRSRVAPARRSRTSGGWFSTVSYDSSMPVDMSTTPDATQSGASVRRDLTRPITWSEKPEVIRFVAIPSDSFWCFPGRLVGEDRADPVQGRLGRPVQMVQVHALIAEHHHQRGVTDGVEGRAAVAAVRHRPAQGAAGGRPRGAPGEAEAGRGQRGEPFRIDRVSGVRGDEQSVRRGQRGVRDSGDLFAQAAHFERQGLVIHRVNSSGSLRI